MRNTRRGRRGGGGPLRATTATFVALADVHVATGADAAMTAATVQLLEVAVAAQAVAEPAVVAAAAAAAPLTACISGTEDAVDGLLACAGAVVTEALAVPPAARDTLVRAYTAMSAPALAAAAVGDAVRARGALDESTAAEYMYCLAAAGGLGSSGSGGAIAPHSPAAALYHDIMAAYVRDGAASGTSTAVAPLLLLRPSHTNALFLRAALEAGASADAERLHAALAAADGAATTALRSAIAADSARAAGGLDGVLRVGALFRGVTLASGMGGVYWEEQLAHACATAPSPDRPLGVARRAAAGTLLPTAAVFAAVLASPALRRTPEARLHAADMLAGAERVVHERLCEPLAALYAYDAARAAALHAVPVASLLRRGALGCTYVRACVAAEQLPAAQVALDFVGHGGLDASEEAAVNDLGGVAAVAASLPDRVSHALAPYLAVDAYIWPDKDDTTAAYTAVITALAGKGLSSSADRLCGELERSPAVAAALAPSPPDDASVISGGGGGGGGLGEGGEGADEDIEADSDEEAGTSVSIENTYKSLMVMYGLQGRVESARTAFESLQRVRTRIRALAALGAFAEEEAAAALSRGAGGGALLTSTPGGVGRGGAPAVSSPHLGASASPSSARSVTGDGAALAPPQLSSSVTALLGLDEVQVLEGVSMVVEMAVPLALPVLDDGGADGLDAMPAVQVVRPPADMSLRTVRRSHVAGATGAISMHHSSMSAARATADVKRQGGATMNRASALASSLQAERATSLNNLAPPPPPPLPPLPDGSSGGGVPAGAVDANGVAPRAPRASTSVAPAAGAAPSAAPGAAAGAAPSAAAGSTKAPAAGAKPAAKAPAPDARGRKSTVSAAVAPPAATSGGAPPDTTSTAPAPPTASAPAAAKAAGAVIGGGLLPVVEDAAVVSPGSEDDSDSTSDGCAAPVTAAAPTAAAVAPTAADDDAPEYLPPVAEPTEEEAHEAAVAALAEVEVEEVSDATAAPFNSLILAYAERGQLDLAVAVLTEMAADGVCPDSGTLVALILAYAASGQGGRARDVVATVAQVMVNVGASMDTVADVVNSVTVVAAQLYALGTDGRADLVVAVWDRWLAAVSPPEVVAALRRPPPLSPARAALYNVYLTALSTCLLVGDAAAAAAAAAATAAAASAGRPRAAASTPSLAAVATAAAAAATAAAAAVSPAALRDRILAVTLHDLMPQASTPGVVTASTLAAVALGLAATGNRAGARRLLGTAVEEYATGEGAGVPGGLLDAAGFAALVPALATADLTADLRGLLMHAALCALSAGLQPPPSVSAAAGRRSLAPAAAPCPLWRRRRRHTRVTRRPTSARRRQPSRAWRTCGTRRWRGALTAVGRCRRGRRGWRSRRRLRHPVTPSTPSRRLTTWAPFLPFCCAGRWYRRRPIAAVAAAAAARRGRGWLASTPRFGAAGLLRQRRRVRHRRLLTAPRRRRRGPAIWLPTYALPRWWAATGCRRRWRSCWARAAAVAAASCVQRTGQRQKRCRCCWRRWRLMLGRVACRLQGCACHLRWRRVWAWTAACGRQAVLPLTRRPASRRWRARWWLRRAHGAWRRGTLTTRHLWSCMV